jgi:hypothetical protein
MLHAEISTYLMAAIANVDDVATIVDCLSAHVVYMEIHEEQRTSIFSALQVALKAIEATQ